MESRGIALDDQDLADLNGAMDALSRRGAKESLILLDDKAFIVGVPDRKLITAMTRREAVGNVFSQIDSTVVIR
jgi:flagellar operon protein